jgi:hypothetical protein
LTEKDPEMNLVRGIFDNIRNSAIKKLGLSTRDQRLDSTHIISNIHTRSRLDLFSKTLSLFLKSLPKTKFSRIPKPIQKWHTSESEGWFGLGPAEQKVKLIELARYIYKLIIIFEKDKEIKNSETYQILERLFQEQCEVKNTVIKDQGTVLILLKPATIQESLKSLLIMKSTEQPDPILPKCCLLLLAWNLLG